MGKLRPERKRPYPQATQDVEEITEPSWRAGAWPSSCVQSLLPSQCLSFPTCKIGFLIIPSPRVEVRMKWLKPYKVLSTALASEKIQERSAAAIRS